MRNLHNRLTYANVVATLALFAALTTGGAYAATQLAKNSVGAKQIRKGAVGSRALDNGGIATRDLSKKVRGRLGKTERANVASDGALLAGTAQTANRGEPSTYTVRFDRSVGNCTSAATPALSGAGEPAAGSATITGFAGRELTVTTYDAAGAPAALGFHLIIVC